MSLKLISLVQADPELMIYALEHLGENVPPNPANKFYGDMLRMARQQIAAQLLLVFIGKDPVHRLTPDQIARLEKKWGRRADELAKLEQTTEALRGIAKTLREADIDTIRLQLHEANPTIRLLTIQIIAQRRLPLEGDLIDLLDDPNVRSAAHDALVRLARGVDFGPVSGASKRSIERSIDKWKYWLELQWCDDRVRGSHP